MKFITSVKKFYDTGPRNLYYKPLCRNNYFVSQKARVFETVSHLQTGITFASKAGVYQSGALKGLNTYGWLPALPTNIRLEWK
jgi:hypothetical protein